MRLVPVLILAVSATIAQAADLDCRILEDHTGNPLASVSVRVGKPGQPRLLADLETDTAGRFHIANLYTGEYRIEISKPNYQPLALTVYLPDSSAQLTRIFRLVRGSSISGQAIDGHGKPMEAAHVYAIPKSANGLESPKFPTMTDSNGKYRLFNLPPGEYEIALAWGQRANVSETATGVGSGFILYPGRQQATVFSISGGEQYQANFVVAPAILSSISGKVDRELKPAEGNFWVTLFDRNLPGLALATTTTKPDGSFRLDGLEGCDCYLVAAGPSRGWGGEGGILETKPLYGRVRINFGGQNVENLVIPMKEGPSARYVLSPATSAACPALAQMTLVSREDWGVALKRTLDVTSTVQTLENLAPAEYHANVEVADHSCYAEPQLLDLIPGHNDTPNGVDFELKPGGSIQGSVVAGARASNYVIVLSDSDTTQVAVPDASGAFRFDGLRPGKYRWAAEPSAADNQARWISASSHFGEVTVRAGVVSTVELLEVEGQK